MTTELPAFAQSLISYGLAGAFLIASLEKLLPVIPSIGLYLLLGLLSGGGSDTLASLILVTATGSTIGSLCWFAIARIAAGSGGNGAANRILARFAHRTAAPKACFTRWTISSAAAVQLLPVARAYTGLLYGSSGVSLLGFALATFAGCCVWNAVLTSIGRMIATL